MSEQNGLLYPLDEFYARAGRPLPTYASLEDHAVPSPYHGLLVHRNDMTPTLQAFHSSSIHVRVLATERSGDHYYRQVLLIRDSDDRTVEFGAIRMDLSHFTEEAKTLILEGHRPLGQIMADFSVPHRSDPSGYMRIESDPFMEEALGLNRPVTLYARRNRLMTPGDRSLAEIVEILPPAPAAGEGAQA